MSVAFKVEGLDVLQKQLLALMDSAKATKALRSAARASFKSVIQDARSNVKVDTGELRDSIKLSVVVPEVGSVVLAVGIKIGHRKLKDEVTELLDDGTEGETSKVSTNVDAGWRWHFLEFGTAKMRAQPFLRPALDHNHMRVVEDFKERLRRIVERALRQQKADQ